MSDLIDVSDLDKAAVLAALYNASKPLGAGFMDYDPTPMTAEEAHSLIEGGVNRFDYLKGRVMKVDLSSDQFDPWGYDRDNGEGAAQRAIEAFRSTQQVDNEYIQTRHEAGTRDALEDVKQHVNEPITVSDNGEVVNVNLGLADLAPHLRPAIERAEASLTKPTDENRR